MKGRGMQAAQLDETVAVARRVKQELGEWKDAAERMQRRVVGLEEEGREVRRRVNRLGE